MNKDISILWSARVLAGVFIGAHLYGSTVLVDPAMAASSCVPIPVSTGEFCNGTIMVDWQCGGTKPGGWTNVWGGCFQYARSYDYCQCGGPGDCYVEIGTSGCYIYYSSQCAPPTPSYWSPCGPLNSANYECGDGYSDGGFSDGPGDAGDGSGDSSGDSGGGSTGADGGDGGSGGD